MNARFESHLAALQASVGGTALETFATAGSAGSLRVGGLRLSLHKTQGARIEVETDRPDSCEGAARRRQTVWRPPAVDVRAGEEAAIWEALAAGSDVVRIDAQAGGGATSLLAALAANAAGHGFAVDAVLATDVRRPAADVLQYVASLLEPGQPPRYRTPDELARLANRPRTLVLVDRAALDPATVTELRQTFTNACFVIVNDAPLPHAAAVRLGPLRNADALALLESGYGRRIDADNADLALHFSATANTSPGLVRLIGVAARELARSFVSLYVRYDSADDVVRAFIAGLPAPERLILETMALARVPLAAHHIAYVLRSVDIRASLDHLLACELVRDCGGELYELPQYVEQRVAPPGDDGAVFTRVVDALCDVCDSWPSLPILNRQLAGAEPVLADAAERSRWERVIALGARLAPMFALHAQFGAWGRVLRAVETAAARSGDTAALHLARHDLAVRATVLGESNEAPAAAQSAGHDHLPLAAARGELAASVRAPVAPWWRRDNWPLLLVGPAIAAALLFAAGLRPRPSPAPAIAQFSSSPLEAAGRSAQLCVEATATSVVEIFPDGDRLPGSGRHCLSVHPPVTTTYFAVGTAADGRQARSALTLVVPRSVPPVKIAAFAARPARIRSGQQTRLCYAVTGARVLHIVPRVADLTQLRACATITLRTPHRYRYELDAMGENGQSASRQVYVEVLPPARAAVAKKQVRVASGDRLTRQAIYQFDATPGILTRGQAASLCAGIDRPARGFVTHVGLLEPGVTRCYRVQPSRTTVYRLYVALSGATAVEKVTVAVRPPLPRNDIAHDDRR